LAAASGSQPDLRRNAEHIINIIEGEEGEFYGDWDGRFGVQNPGDGFGLIPYINEMKMTALLSAEAVDATRAIKAHAEHVEIASDSALMWAEMIRDAALTIVQPDSPPDLDQQLAAIATLSPRLLLGEDTDGDSNISLIEGGVFTAYQHAQYQAAIGLIEGETFTFVDPGAAAEAPSETALSGDEVVIEMFDFEFSPPSLTIQEGTTVLIINRGVDKHSVTADSGSFDTGLLDPNHETTLTFDEPGFFPYYCLLHGGPGGVGMSGAITVIEAGETPEPTAEPQPEPRPGLRNLPLRCWISPTVSLT
jgi:plastocyanin